MAANLRAPTPVHGIADMDEEDRSIVSTLWCVICQKYEGRVCEQKNFSKAWIDGSTNHKTSNVTNHACSKQHKSAMALFRMDQAKSKHEPITTYSPIARSVLSMAMNPSKSRESLKSVLFLQKSTFPS